MSAAVRSVRHRLLLIVFSGQCGYFKSRLFHGLIQTVLSWTVWLGNDRMLSEVILLTAGNCI